MATPWRLGGFQVTRNKILRAGSRVRGFKQGPLLGEPCQRSHPKDREIEMVVERWGWAESDQYWCNKDEHLFKECAAWGKGIRAL